MMKQYMSFNISFEAHQTFRLDTLINEQLIDLGEEKGVVRIEVPEGLVLSNLEYEPRMISDFSETYNSFLKKFPQNPPDYLKNILPGHRMDIPFNNKRLVIGDWQQIVFYTLKNFDKIDIQLEFHISHQILGLEHIESTAELQTFDMTDIIERTLAHSKADYITLIVPSMTAALYTLNGKYYENLIRFLRQIVPQDSKHLHTHGENKNAFGYIPVRAAFLPHSLTLPIKRGELELPEKSRLYLTELDIQPRRRDIYFELWNKGE